MPTPCSTWAQKTVVIKGIVHGDQPIIRNYLASAAEGGQVEEVSSELLPYMLHGTGDLFASALTAAIYTGRTTREAVDFAGELVRDAMRITRELAGKINRFGAWWPVSDRGGEGAGEQVARACNM